MLGILACEIIRSVPAIVLRKKNLRRFLESIFVSVLKRIPEGISNKKIQQKFLKELLLGRVLEKLPASSMNLGRIFARISGGIVGVIPRGSLETRSWETLRIPEEILKNFSKTILDKFWEEFLEQFLKTSVG